MAPTPGASSLYRRRTRLLSYRYTRTKDGRRGEVGRVGQVIVGRSVGRQRRDKRATVLGRKVRNILEDRVIALPAKLFQFAGKRVHHGSNRVVDRLLLFIPIDRRNIGIHLLPRGGLLPELVQRRPPIGAHGVVVGEHGLRVREVTHRGDVGRRRRRRHQRTAGRGRPVGDGGADRSQRGRSTVRGAGQIIVCRRVFGDPLGGGARICDEL